MEFFPPVVFEVKAKATEAIAAFGTINKELATMEKNGNLASASITRLEAAAKYARTAIIGFGGAFAVLGVASLETLDKVELAQANLETAVKNTGVAFDVALPYIKSHAEEMKKLGFTYEDTYAALAKMTAATGSPKVALESLTAAADLARFKHMSLAEAGTLIAKASTGAARGLADLGIRMGVTIPKGASLAQILTIIEQKTNGAAEAFGSTLGGKLAIAKANFQALEVEIGTQLLPYAIKLTDWVSKTAIPKFKEFADFLRSNAGALKILGEAVVGFWIGGKIIAGIMATVKAVEALRVAYVTTGIAAAFASGGLSLATAATALGAAGLIVGGTLGLKNVLEGKTIYGKPMGGGSSSPKPTPTPTPSSTAIPSTLKGKGQTTVTATPKPSASPTTVQNITVYATDTNDIAKKLAKASKTGVPIGRK